MNSSSEAIELSHVTKRFKSGVTALSDISFSVARGELFGLLGPDGAGKTTLCRLLAAIMTPTSGTVRIGGYGTADSSERIKLSTGYMPRDYGLYNDLSVEENIDFYADIFNVPRRERSGRTEKILTMTGMLAFRKRASGFLSGGMKQKLQLACALIHTPRYLFLDEPTYGVDPVSRREFWKLLLNLLQEGLTIVVSTSYMDEAERCARIALLHEGSVLKLDSPGNIIDSVPGKMIELTSKDAAEKTEILEKLPGVKKVTLYGETLHLLTDPDFDGAAVAGALGSGGILHMKEAKPSLEDSFIFLIEQQQKKNHE